MDTFISDFSVALGVGQIMAGGILTGAVKAVRNLSCSLIFHQNNNLIFFHAIFYSSSLSSSLYALLFNIVFRSRFLTS